MGGSGRAGAQSRAYLYEGGQIPQHPDCPALIPVWTAVKLSFGAVLGAWLADKLCPTSIGAFSDTFCGEGEPLDRQVHCIDSHVIPAERPAPCVRVSARNWRILRVSVPGYWKQNGLRNATYAGTEIASCGAYCDMSTGDEACRLGVREPCPGLTWQLGTSSTDAELCRNESLVAMPLRSRCQRALPPSSRKRTNMGRTSFTASFRPSNRL